MPIALTLERHFNSNQPPFNQPVTHGIDLTVNDVGPWALQQRLPGSELLLAQPSVGHNFRFNTLGEWCDPTTPWPAAANDSNLSVLNDPALHYGVVTGTAVTVDGYTIPVGTIIVQFVRFPDDGNTFYCQGENKRVLFRGCQFRYTLGTGGEGLFNDSFADPVQRIWMHYCDMGLKSLDPPDEWYFDEAHTLGPYQTSGYLNIKFLGSSGHRVFRCHHTRSATFLQPNVNGCEFTENWLEQFVYVYGAAGQSGLFDSSAAHINGISSEGGIASIRYLRNHIVAASPDGATGTGVGVHTTPGGSGYGTQEGQLSWSGGSAPGRDVDQTDCIALFQTLNGPNLGAAPGDILIEGNYLAGTGYCIYAGGSGSTGIWMIDNKVSTRWFQFGAAFGPLADAPAWGAAGNFQSGNVWADDYGSATSPGHTLTEDRQYPSGDGPRVGQSWA